MHRPFLLLLALLLSLTNLFGQQDQSRIYQVSGMIISRTTSEAIPFARVEINQTRNGVLSNQDGFYSVPVTDRDTLYFSHLGYHQGKFVVSDYLRNYKGKSQYLYVINYLVEDTLTLPTVYIFPYDTPEELKTAVVNMGAIENSPEALAQQNMDPVTLHAIMQSMPLDGNERLMVGRQAYYNYYQNRNILPTVGLDPITATRMLQYIVQKAKKRKNKDLNYWEN